MSRAYIENLLSNDGILAGYGVSQYAVFNQHDINERPRNDGRFIILRWEEPTSHNSVLNRSPRLLTVCAHSPLEISTDFDTLDKILDRVDALLLPLTGVSGSDGYTITSVASSGRSGDLKDEGFMTATRNAGYAVLSRRT